MSCFCPNIFYIKCFSTKYNMLVISTHIPKSPQKVRNWSDPPPPLWQMTIEKLLFFRDGFPKEVGFQPCWSGSPNMVLFNKPFLTFNWEWPLSFKDALPLINLNTQDRLQVMHLTLLDPTKTPTIYSCFADSRTKINIGFNVATGITNNKIIKNSIIL